MIVWYIDESGITKNERFLAVGGYGINEKDYEKIVTEFNNFRITYIPFLDRKLDMKKLMQGKEWARSLKMDERKKILSGFYDFLEQNDIRIVIYSIDKDFSSRIRNKLQFAYECLFERICLNVEDISKINKKKELGIIFTDLMLTYEEVSSWFGKFYETGTRYVKNNLILIEKIIPLKMSQSTMLQIADLIVCTCTYFLKAEAGQKSSSWAKDILRRGYNIIREKAKTVNSQDGTKLIPSFKHYAY